MFVLLNFLLNSNSNSTQPMFLNRIALSFFWIQTMFLGVISFVILWSLLCLLILYKRLPSKVTLLSSVLNVYFIGFQLFSEEKLYLSTSLISTTALHIEIISLVDETTNSSRNQTRILLKSKSTLRKITKTWMWTRSPRVNYMKSNQCCRINWSPEPRFRRTEAY